MKSSVLLSTWLLLTSPLFAQDFAGDLGRRSEISRIPHLTKEARANLASNYTPLGSVCVRQVLAKDITIQPKATVSYELDPNIGGADNVVISLTSLGDSNFTKVRISAAYADAGDWYVLSTATWGSSLAWLDHGAITVPVAGPYLKVIVYNDDIVPVKLRQLAVYAVIR